MGSALPKKQVLIVTKEEAVRAFDAEICKARGFETLHARWGEEALEVYRKNRPIALVITDLLYEWSDWRLARQGDGLSVKNGIQLALALRKLSRKQKVLIHTYAPADQVRSHVTVESVILLQKPFRPEDLGEYLDQV